MNEQLFLIMLSALFTLWSKQYHEYLTYHGLQGGSKSGAGCEASWNRSTGYERRLIQVKYKQISADNRSESRTNIFPHK